MSRMFKLWKSGSIPTVNPLNGCGFNCYGGRCWAAQTAKRLEAQETKGYENGFKPSFVPERMNVPSGADVVWIGSMGDIAFQSTKNVRRIIDRMIKPNPEVLFFLETKKPSTYRRFIDYLPENVMISTTIETNRSYDVSKAPRPQIRFTNFWSIEWPKKHVSIEPIMMFDLPTMVNWMRLIDPIVVSVGYDNYNCGLPEPPRDLTMRLIEDLGTFTDVEIKSMPEEEDPR